MIILTINERFKEVRIKLNKTQAEFGEQCGLGRAVIANIENNRSPVTPLYIKVVVDNFGVNEEWLRDGTLPMFLETKEQTIDKLAKKYGLDDFMRKVIMAFAELSDSEKDAVKSFILKITPPDDPEQREWLRTPTIKAAPFPTNETEQVVDFARDPDDVRPTRNTVSKADIEAALNDDSIKSDDDL